MSVRRGLVSACVLALSPCLLAAPAPASGLDDRVLFGESVDGVIAGRNTQIDGGVVGANGRIVVRRGAVVPDLEGASDVRIRRGVQAGAIRAGGTVTVHRTASVGPVTAHASVPNQALPVLEASPDPSRDVIRKAKDVKAGPLVLAPGRYGAVRAVKGDRVVLRSGTYDLEELTLREDTTLVVQLAGGRWLCGSAATLCSPGV